MKHIRIVPARLLVMAVLSLAAVVNAEAQEARAKFDEYMNALTSQQRFTGAVLVARDGKPVYSRAVGLANAEWDIPNTPQTKFRLGSMTKQFTAAAVLLLQERGKIDVQDPVCKYVENCPEAWKVVTVHHLLSHTGGVPNFTSFPDYRNTMMTPTTMDGLVARFKDRPLDFKPGEKFGYSNSGYVLLGHIVEKVAGESYESFLQKNVFGPLGMNDTGYDRHATILKQRATGYAERNGQRVNSLPVDMSIPHAAGALYSTVDDLFLWNEALFGDRLLTATSRELMTTPVRNDYGYGLEMRSQHQRKAVSHSGSINGFATFLSRFPEEKVTVVVLRNAEYGLPGPGRIAEDLGAILFGEKYEIPRARVAIKVDPKLYDAYVGQYEDRPGFIITVTREGDRLGVFGVVVTPPGEPAELFPESETKFFLKVREDTQVSFVKDDKGAVTHLILHQGSGAERHAKKVQ